MRHPGALPLIGILIFALVVCLGLNLACSSRHNLSSQSEVEKAYITHTSCGYMSAGPLKEYNATCVCHICITTGWGNPCGLTTMPASFCVEAKESDE